jgi:hypothetical protein
MYLIPHIFNISENYEKIFFKKENYLIPHILVLIEK